MDNDVQKMIQEQFSKLPLVVQKAILSGHVSEKFRELAGKHRLHLDQWQQIENLIMYTVLGLSPPNELPAKIAAESGLSIELANELVNDVTSAVFEPIREELERELGAPQAKEESVNDMEKLRTAVLEEKPVARPPVTSAPPPNPLPPLPGTPPAPPPTEKIARAPASGAYIPGEVSTARANVVDDPYREPPV